jgi:hypothetical protein
MERIIFYMPGPNLDYSLGIAKALARDYGAHVQLVDFEFVVAIFQDAELAERASLDFDPCERHATTETICNTDLGRRLWGQHV